MSAAVAARRRIMRRHRSKVSLRNDLSISAASDTSYRTSPSADSVTVATNCARVQRSSS